MFKIHLGKTKHSLNQEDFRELGKLSEGYSGSDIAIVVREALMEPVRMVQDATHYKRVSRNRVSWAYVRWWLRIGPIRIK
jgi:vacuolar protein-sorting-associated protein 4